jgi:hypothetical protein
LALQKLRRTIANIKRETSRISQERNWIPPSYSTVKRIVQKLDPQLVTLAQEGSKAYSEEFDSFIVIRQVPLMRFGNLITHSCQFMCLMNKKTLSSHGL